jgi:hypothetical protein
MRRYFPLRLTLQDGSVFSGADLGNRPVALTFMSTWADWYLEEKRPEMAKRAIEHAHRLEELKKAHPGISWVSIASPVWTAASDLDEYLERLEATGPLGIDEDSLWFRHYGVRDVPTTIFIGADGVEIARAHDPEGLMTAVAKLRHTLP